MVAFGFLLKYLGGGRDLRMMAFLEKECNLSCEDTQSLLAVKKIPTFFHSQVMGTQILWT